MTVQYRIHQDVAVISLDHAPTNTLDLRTRSDLLCALGRAAEDTTVAAIVLHGSGRGFSGGADINEFPSQKAFHAPDLPTVISFMELIGKPIVAALHGMAMGGGLELALACHYRVAAAGCMIGLPEVRLGLVPGAGGTQRLPRVLGAESSLNMILSGKAVAAKVLAGIHDQKLIEELVVSQEAPLEEAIFMAREAAQRHRGGEPLPRIRDMSCRYDDSDAYFQFVRNMVENEAKNAPAKNACVDAVEAAVSVPFDEGIATERRLFEQLLNSPHSKAARHLFLAERAAARIADVGPDVPIRDVKHVAVIGAGTMGRGICMNFLQAGFLVTLVDAKQDALDVAVEDMRKVYGMQVRTGVIDSDAYEGRLAALRATRSYADVEDADLAIEAVFEDKAVKEAVFRELDAVLKPGAIIASNTSTLDIDWLAALTRRPQDVVGMHFFSPAHVMRLLEVVRAQRTDKSVMATVMAIGKRINKVCVVAGVCDGFIGNRMIDPYLRQAGFLLDEGCTPQQVDSALEKFGFAMGPFRMSDLAGNDVGWHIRKRRYMERPDIKYSRAADALCEMGRFGQKVGAGWYDYAPGRRDAVPSAVVDELLRKHRHSLGVQARVVTDEEIVGRLVYALVNEGARILEEGIADKASDIDVVYVTGYGFPAWRGGPMHYANQVGIWSVREDMKRYARNPLDDVSFWQPAPLIDQLADARQVFGIDNKH
ncbi:MULTISPECIES: 3-hydroxyacyl-CoA dehydrogenase NAD-binding domain-containing protein [Burkholderia]|uniref:3-hydroxyacyl-CoA dehydrogenase NAD-binding domain-containing protein n=1 Tax=Burkholderia TaxID=32008 RepID=UPI00078BE9EF|nr:MULTISPECIES: 3-hydroxyacyl-CoA dehydrogenase NAD-binding domain-containing protein [Burkholderia]AMU04680.1 3-hydroxyacyl-CoA dehydrogenase [Burkholderia cenocepacia]RQS24184.1 3-hydroxyacyl-CoA dehydrogenase [Burkholderia sp. Bp8995]RQS38913.1 3-hydroxyacyl-CoA dehydrogenase [Burkholderia sp. Bp8989]